MDRTAADLETMKNDHRRFASSFLDFGYFASFRNESDSMVTGVRSRW